MSTEELAQQAAPLDALLIQAALGPARQFAPDLATARLLAGLAARPLQTARRLSWLRIGPRVGPRRGYLLQLLAGAGWTSLPFLPAIRQPALVLAGNDDPLIPLVNARVMQRLLPHARLHVYDDGHLGLLTMADVLAPLVADFLS